MATRKNPQLINAAASPTKKAISAAGDNQDNLFLSCRAVLNWIAFGQDDDENLVNWPDSDDCDPGLLEALEAMADGRAFRPDDGRPLPSYVELEARARRLVARTGNTAADLAKAMKPKVDARESEQKQRREKWDEAIDKLSAATAGGLRTHTPAGPYYKGRESPDWILSHQLTGGNISKGFYLRTDVLKWWPSATKAELEQGEVSRLLCEEFQRLRDAGKPVLTREYVLNYWRKESAHSATASQARKALADLPPLLKRGQGQKK